MITFGPATAIDFNREMVILNLSGYIEGFERVSILPNFICQPGSEAVFDNMYAAFILNNNQVFYEFMKIMIAQFNGMDVYVIISDMFYYVAESLQKFILARYGIVCNNIYTIEDWDTVVESSFDINGIYNMDKDKEKFISVYIDVNGVENFNKANEAMNQNPTKY